MNKISRHLPLITVGLSCFNAEGTIGRALESARAQDWPYLEILVVDDGSSDGSVEEVRRLAREDERIRLIGHEMNRGAAAARNTILRQATGTFIAFFDDDDMSDGGRVFAQWNRLTEYEKKHGTELATCYTNRRVVEAEPLRTHGTYNAIGRCEAEPHGQIVADYILWHFEDPAMAWGHLGSCTLMFRRSLFMKVGNFDERFRRCAEWDWAIRLAFLGGHFLAVDRPLVTQYITRTADKSGRVPLKYALQLRKKYRSYLKEENLYLASVAIAHSRFHYAKGDRWKSKLFLALACLCAPRNVLRNELSKRRRKLHR